jgi:23S rRNA (uracil1939-C5)-methyltransferase
MSVTILRLGHLGDGIADGPVYASRTLPGEVIAGEVVDGRIDAPKIVTPSPSRVAATCPHYRGCGGCHLQHASDGFVEEWKEGVVRAALAGQGLDAPIRGVSTSPPRSRRRASLHGRRLKSGAKVGFHGRASGAIVTISECLLLRPPILSAFPSFEALTVLAASRKSEVTLAVLETETGLDVALSEALPLDGERFTAASNIAEAHDLARLTWNREIVVERRPPMLHLGPARVVPPPGAFLQATAEGEAALLSAVSEAVGDAPRVVDLFAGCGTFPLPLAIRSEVHAVEGDAAMILTLDRAWRQTQGLKRITSETRDLFRRPLRPEELDRFDAAVIDPPRAGAEAQTAALARSNLRRIAAVSCNPVTFARDARILVDGGFRLEWVQVVDQFRWSPHVELAASFVRGHMRD